MTLQACEQASRAMRALHQERYLSRPHYPTVPDRLDQSHQPKSFVGKHPYSDLTLFTGVCPFGAKCRFDHNPDKVSMCKTFFRTGSCPNGDRCDLSHKPTYNRVPACTHYQNGNCTNNACRYAHVSTSPGPLICRSFALLGYCETGTKCDKRHIIECPDYAENGECTNKKCKLPHTRHAHIERQKRTSDDDSELEDEEDEESGGENTDSKDVDSDDLDEDIVMNGDGHEISQNQDFISFS